MGIEKRGRIAVIGAGLMGHGIAQEFAVAGYAVGLYDVTGELLQRAMERIRGNLAQLAGLGIIGREAAEAAVERITPGATLAETVPGANLVLEAVTEDLAVKQPLFAELDRLCPPTTVLASNTSSFMPGLLAAHTQHPERILIMHYFNPPYLLPLVEVVPHPGTDEATVQTAMDLLTGIGKTPILLRREAPGFVGNRLQMAMLREALHIVQEGIASAEEVDAVVRNGFGRRLAVAGPFELCDLAGWDVWRAITGQLLPELNSGTDVPNIVQERLDRGELGVKSGKGFYEWDAGSTAAARARIARALLAMAQWGGEHSE